MSTLNTKSSAAVGGWAPVNGRRVTLRVNKDGRSGVFVCIEDVKRNALQAAE